MLRVDPNSWSAEACARRQGAAPVAGAPAIAGAAAQAR